VLRFNSRIGHYRSAHLTVATADLSPEEVVGRILVELERQWPVDAKIRAL
jgi:hypothetical protein